MAPSRALGLLESSTKGIGDQCWRQRWTLTDKGLPQPASGIERAAGTTSAFSFFATPDDKDKPPIRKDSNSKDAQDVASSSSSDVSWAHETAEQKARVLASAATISTACQAIASAAPSATPSATVSPTLAKSLPPAPRAKLTQTIKGVNIIISIYGNPGKKTNDLSMRATAETVQRRMPRDGKEEGSSRNPLLGWWCSFKHALQNVFLPVGYPKTVGDKYIDFVWWQSVSNFCVTANSVLASTFLLYAVGMGDGAIATASALNWHFLAMGSVANCLKGLAWMANLSYARDNNIADITAKSTSQFIFASLFGTAVGASICTIVQQDFQIAFSCYAIFSVATCLSAYKTVTVIPLVTLNNKRLQLLCENFLECMHVMRKQGANQEELKPRHLDRCYKDQGMEYDHSYDGDLIEMIPNPVTLSAVDPPLPAWLNGDQRFLNPSITASILRRRMRDGEHLSFKELPELRIALQDTLLTAERLTAPFMTAISSRGWKTEKIVVEAEKRRGSW
eukprot:gene28268-31374_t